MSFLLLMLMLSSSSPLWANSEILSRIYDIDPGNKQVPTLILLENGKVLTFDSADKSALVELQEGLRSKAWLKFKLIGKQLIDIETVPPPLEVKFHQKTLPSATPYRPSILTGIDEARLLFYEARIDSLNESQCFNRAHIWSYEWRIKKNVYSSKSWLFFTRRFIRKYDFDWWFHVAPMVHVIIDNQVKERVMDIKYSKGPLTLKQWTDIFMRDSSPCPVVQRYTDYADYPESSSCYVMKSSMYYYQPSDLHESELSAVEKNKWVETEVKGAYLDGFGVTL